MKKSRRNKFHELLVSNLPEPESIIRTPELMVILNRSRSTIGRWVNQKQLPEPLRHENGRLIGWRRREINSFLNKPQTT
jgi:predicted DNA-binding transcriptional regulator AlpA